MSIMGLSHQKKVQFLKWIRFSNFLLFILLMENWTDKFYMEQWMCKLLCSFKRTICPMAKECDIILVRSRSCTSHSEEIFSLSFSNPFFSHTFLQTLSKSGTVSLLCICGSSFGLLSFRCVLESTERQSSDEMLAYSCVCVHVCFFVECLKNKTGRSLVRRNANQRFGPAKQSAVDLIIPTWFLEF